MSEGSAADVHEFWFGELRDGLASRARRRRWFAFDAAGDDEIRRRFGPLLARARTGELAPWREDPGSALALVLICDQFSRQVHRGSVDAYATDGLALSVAGEVIEHGADRQLGCHERAFLYMPFQHSESRLDQHTSVGLFGALRDEVPAAARRQAADFLHHALQHRDIVQRFGRFPHRNRILGRRSTAEELDFLAGASSYGQGAPPAS